jgi:DNA-binding CsgD family transcriptional regulator
MEPLLEREAELAQLSELLDETREGRGSTVAIEGPPGIGKTRLLAAARDMAARESAQVLQARGGDLEHDLPFGVVRQLYELALRRVEDRESLLEGPAGLAESLLFNWEEAGEAAGSEERSSAVLHGLYWLTSNLAEREPLVLCVDDAHWSDFPSLRFLHYLTRRIDDLPVLLVLTLRPTDAEVRAELVSRLRSEPVVRTLRPAPLSPVAIAALVRSRLGDQAAPEFCDACHAATAGNPFLARELIAELQANVIEPNVEEAARVSSLLPDAVARYVLARLARLPEAAQDLARAVALLDLSVEPSLGAALAGLDDEAGADAAEVLARAELLRPGMPLEFAHPLIRDAIRDELSQGERAAAHSRAARILHEHGASPDRVAAQLLATAPLDEGWEVGVLRDAARAAGSQGAPEAAVNHLRRALEERLPDSERRGVLYELGVAEAQARMESGVTHLSDALELAEDHDQRTRLTGALALALIHFNRQPEAAEVLRRELDRADGASAESRLQLESDLASTLLFGVDVPLAELDTRLARVEGQLSPETPAGRGLLAALALRRVQRGEDASRAASLSELVLEKGLLDDVGPGSTVFFNAVLTLICTGASGAARRWLGEALRRSQDSGFPLAMAMNLNLHSWESYRCGAIAEAEASAADSLRIVRDYEIPIGPPAVIGSVVDALVARGRDDAAWEELERDGFTGPLPEVFTAAWLYEARGRLRAQGGNPAPAVADLLEAGERFRRWGQVGCEPSGWRALAAEQLIRLERTDEAAQLARDELELARRFGVPHSLGRALRVNGLIAGGAEGLRLLRQSVEVLEPSPARLELALALCDLGGALRRTGERRAAREQLRQALELAHRCGATALEDRARQELLATGARPRRIPVSGVDSLTPSERRVAKMAAEGLSNREIAGSLFVSLKTVEMHLSRVYRKLDLSSRTELAGALEPPADSGLVQSGVQATESPEFERLSPAS